MERQRIRLPMDEEAGVEVVFGQEAERDGK
jgi:hypothetical protein